MHIIVIIIAVVVVVDADIIRLRILEHLGEDIPALLRERILMFSIKKNGVAM